MKAIPNIKTHGQIYFVLLHTTKVFFISCCYTYFLDSTIPFLFSLFSSFTLFFSTPSYFHFFFSSKLVSHLRSTRDAKPFLSRKPRSSKCFILFSNFSVFLICLLPYVSSVSGAANTYTYTLDFRLCPKNLKNPHIPTFFKQYMSVDKI